MGAMNRRILFGSVAGAALAAQPRKSRIGLIGCGGRAGVDARAALAGGAEVAALCDVDSAHLDESAAELERQQGLRPRTLKHSTPPWRALLSIAACRRKPAVYRGKPPAYDIRAGRAMVDAWEKAGKIGQVGFQRRQSEAFRQAREFIVGGGTGQPDQVDGQMHYTARPLDNTPQAPPATLDWALWPGPAPQTPYWPNAAHRAWRLEEKLGNGHLVDWGIRLIDAWRRLPGLGAPKAIAAGAGIYSSKGRLTTPDTLMAHFEFEQCPVGWRHRPWGATESDSALSNGVFVYGGKGRVSVTESRGIHLTKARGAERKRIEIQPAEDPGRLHVAEWLAAAGEGRQPGGSPGDALLSTSTVQLGMIAYKAGRAIERDPAPEKIVNDAALHRLLLRPYRAPYQHPSS